MGRGTSTLEQRARKHRALLRDVRSAQTRATIRLTTPKDSVGDVAILMVDYAKHKWNRRALSALWASGDLEVVDGTLRISRDIARLI